MTATAFTVTARRPDGSHESHLVHSPSAVADKVWEIVDTIPEKDYEAIHAALAGRFVGGMGQTVLPDGTTLTAMRVST